MLHQNCHRSTIDQQQLYTDAARAGSYDESLQQTAPIFIS
jgi:hypothetical protein